MTKYVCVEYNRPEATATSDICHKCEIKQVAEERAEDEELRALLAEEDSYYDDMDWYVYGSDMDALMYG